MATFIIKLFKFEIKHHISTEFSCLVKTMEITHSTSMRIIAVKQIYPHAQIITLSWSSFHNIFTQHKYFVGAHKIDK